MSKSRNEEYQNDDDRDKKQPVVTGERLNQGVNAPDGGKDTQKKEKNWPKYTEAACAVLLVIITGTYTYYAAGQLHKMKRSVEAAEGANRIAYDALVAGDRAWIAPANAYFTSEISKTLPFSFEVQYRNTGRSPALDVHPIYSLQQVPVSKFEDNTFNNFIETDDASNKCKLLGAAPGADVAYPDQPEGYKLRFTNNSVGWINNGVLTGSTAVVLQMCFAYKTMDVVHRTSFCYFYRKGVSPAKQMNICTAGNHAD